MIHFFDVIRPAVDSLSANRLRTALTVAVISVGITAIVGIETALEILSREVGSSFCSNNSSFAIIPSNEQGARTLQWRDGLLFASRFEDGKVNLRSEISASASVAFGGISTDPTISLVASDENWLEACGHSLSDGRNFTHFEVASSANVCLVGDGIRKKLFEGSDPLGKVIRADGRMLTVIGTISRQGSVMGGGADRSVVFPGGNASSECVISVIPGPGLGANAVTEQARAVMRSVRRLDASKEDDFIISTAEATESRLGSVQSKLSVAALAIGLVTLVGAAISLMNVMLVGVKERFKEIGLRKALGEKRSSIRRQFIVESLIIGQLGAWVGSIIGILAGNIVAISLESDFVFPWQWTLRAMLICIFVSLAAGTMPSSKAASLAPVEALRDF